jgi:hypothetical protein
MTTPAHSSRDAVPLPVACGSIASTAACRLADNPRTPALGRVPDSGGPGRFVLVGACSGWPIPTASAIDCAEAAAITRPLLGSCRFESLFPIQHLLRLRRRLSK